MKLTPAVLALLVGCTDVPQESTLTAYAQYGIGNCPEEDCGLNTGTVNGVYFSNLSLAKKLNTSGVQLIGFDLLPAGMTQLDVVNDRFVAYNADRSQSRWGQNLVGAELKVLVNKEEFRIKITQVHLSDPPGWWAANNNIGRLETYELQWRNPNALPPSSPSTLTQLCRAEPAAGGTLQFDAIIFEGELYKDDTKQRYVPLASEGWFNVACMGSAVAKEFMMRHTQVSKPPIDNTSPAERQALMNAWTANYCGDGVSFTKTGEPLRMRDNKKWIHPASGWSWEYDIGHEPDGELPQLVSYEAIWNETGAVCLNTPRREDKEADIYDTIVAHCEEVGHPLPTCSDDGLAPIGWESQGHILTANPWMPLVAVPVVPPILIAP